MNNTFATDNSAPYAFDIAGYPYGVRVVSYDKYPLASSQAYSGKIAVEVIDASFNRINIDNET